MSENKPRCIVQFNQDNATINHRCPRVMPLFSYESTLYEFQKYTHNSLKFNFRLWFDGSRLWGFHNVNRESVTDLVYGFQLYKQNYWFYTKVLICSIFGSVLSYSVQQRTLKLMVKRVRCLRSPADSTLY